VSLRKNVTRLIAIGNSNGIIIKKKILKEAGISKKDSLIICSEKGKIIIKIAGQKS
jgi:antitoxin component of MazEF toxin-antitoxin module